ncbi:MAG: hypothetical protein KAI77_09585, partial [Gammaproteobacteria bacterium]|nr:hypothetical protein [Gammaproteobacteria bacterium]
TSKRTSYEALQRVTAVMLAQDMIERIRANKNELDGYSGVTVTATPLTVQDCSTECTTAEIKDYDLYQWQLALLGAAETKTIGGVTTNTGGLISPTGCITDPDNTTEGDIIVAIAWRGLTKLSNPGINACGSTSSNYHDTGTDNAFRKVIEIKAFVLD